MGVGRPLMKLTYNASTIDYHSRTQMTVFYIIILESNTREITYCINLLSNARDKTVLDHINCVTIWFLHLLHQFCDKLVIN